MSPQTHDDNAPVAPIYLNARTAQELMTSAPLSVHQTMPCAKAADLLTHFSSIPVIDSDRHIVGVVSRLDLARAVAGGGTASEGGTLAMEEDSESPSGLEYAPPVRVSQVMGTDLVSVSVDASAAEVIRVLTDQQLGRVYVLDADQLLVGVISTKDIVSSLRAG